MLRAALEPADYPYFDYRRFTFSLGIAAGGAVWLSGSTASRFDAGSRAMVVAGDLVAQARVICDKMRVTLEAGGLGFSDVVRLVEYVTPGALADLPRLAALRSEIFAGGAPVVSTIVVKQLLRGEALIEIEAVAARGSRHAIEYLPAVCAADSNEAITRAGHLLRAQGLDWRNVVKTAEFLTPTAATASAGLPDGRHSTLRVVMPRLLDPNAGAQIELAAARAAHAGVVFAAAEGDAGAGDVVVQCREVYARIGRLLAAAGSGLNAVVKTTEFVTPAGLAAYRRTADVRREVFAPPYPAATGVVCERLVQPGAQLAVEATAVVEAA